MDAKFHIPCSVHLAYNGVFVLNLGPLSAYCLLFQLQYLFIFFICCTPTAANWDVIIYMPQRLTEKILQVTVAYISVELCRTQHLVILWNSCGCSLFIGLI